MALGWRIISYNGSKLGRVLYERSESNALEFYR